MQRKNRKVHWNYFWISIEKRGLQVPTLNWAIFAPNSEMKYQRWNIGIELVRFIET